MNNSIQLGKEINNLVAEQAREVEDFRKYRGAKEAYLFLYDKFLTDTKPGLLSQIQGAYMLKILMQSKKIDVMKTLKGTLEGFKDFILKKKELMSMSQWMKVFADMDNIGHDDCSKDPLLNNLKYFLESIHDLTKDLSKDLEASLEDFGMPDDMIDSLIDSFNKTGELPEEIVNAMGGETANISKEFSKFLALYGDLPYDISKFTKYIKFSMKQKIHHISLENIHELPGIFLYSIILALVTKGFEGAKMLSHSMHTLCSDLYTIANMDSLEYSEILSMCNTLNIDISSLEIINTGMITSSEEVLKITDKYGSMELANRLAEHCAVRFGYVNKEQIDKNFIALMCVKGKITSKYFVSGEVVYIVTDVDAKSTSIMTEAEYATVV